MSQIVTVHDVQHWTACRSVVLQPGVVLTAAAWRWLAERGITVRIAAAEELEADAPTVSIEPPEPPETLIQDMAAGSRRVDDTPVDAVDAPPDPSSATAGNMPANTQRAVITVLGKDRVGIIAHITSLLAAANVNILDINQTLFGDLFSMNMAVDIAASAKPFAALKAGLEAVGAEMGVKVLIQRQAVFDYMHRV